MTARSDLDVAIDVLIRTLYDDWPKDWSVEQIVENSDRRASAEELGALKRALAGRALPVVIGGD